MDNRWRILYCFMTELRGRMRKAGAGKGKTGTSGGGARKENPPRRSRSRDVERKEVAKPAGRVPRKAAMAHKAPVPQTDTGGWGENPKAGGRSIVKELGKMAP